MERRPLVIIDGKKAELPVGDTLPGAGASGGSPFLPRPDLIDDRDEMFFYFGWENVNGGWLIRRTERATAQQLAATEANNTSFPDLASAFPERANLTYG